MEISVFWVLIGIFVWPELTFCAILWMLGHPWLGMFALFFAETTNVKEVVKERVIDSKGRTVSERTLG